MLKKKKSAKAPRKKLTSERPLKNRPHDSEQPEGSDQEAAEKNGDEEQLETPDNPKPKRGRQARLPEMEDPEIEELEAAAEKYVEVRDERMALTPTESQRKTHLLGLMKKHNKTTYHHDGFDIRVVAEKETVRVKIKKED